MFFKEIHEKLQIAKNPIRRNDFITDHFFFTNIYQNKLSNSRIVMENRTKCYVRYNITESFIEKNEENSLDRIIHGQPYL